MRVRRTLPARERSLIGAWCFVDHYGPHDVAHRPRHGRSAAPPHGAADRQLAVQRRSRAPRQRSASRAHTAGRAQPHDRRGRHRHSEVSTPATTVLHGVQLWVALPDAHRDTARDFTHYAPPVHVHDGARIRVFLGDLAGAASPAPTFTPLLGAQIDLNPHAGATFQVDPTSSTACWSTSASRGQAALARGGELWYQSQGHDELELTNLREAPGPRARPRRTALPRPTRHVVELRRTQPRRHRPLPRLVGGPRRTLRVGRGLSRRATARASPTERDAARSPQPLKSRKPMTLTTTTTPAHRPR